MIGGSGSESSCCTQRHIFLLSLAIAAAALDSTSNSSTRSTLSAQLYAHNFGRLAAKDRNRESIHTLLPFTACL